MKKRLILCIIKIIMLLSLITSTVFSSVILSYEEKNNDDIYDNVLILNEKGERLNSKDSSVYNVKPNEDIILTLKITDIIDKNLEVELPKGVEFDLDKSIKLNKEFYDVDKEKYENIDFEKIIELQNSENNKNNEEKEKLVFNFDKELYEIKFVLRTTKTEGDFKILARFKEKDKDSNDKDFLESYPLIVSLENTNKSNEIKQNNKIESGNEENSTILEEKKIDDSIVRNNKKNELDINVKNDKEENDKINDNKIVSTNESRLFFSKNKENNNSTASNNTNSNNLVRSIMSDSLSRTVESREEAVSAYFEKVVSSIKSGETGRYKLYLKATGALTDEVNNVRLTIKLPDNKNYYQISNDYSRLSLVGVVPTYDSANNTLNWYIPTMKTGQVYETILQINSKNGIIPNNDIMRAVANVSVDGKNVYNSGDVDITVISQKPVLTVTKKYLGKNGDITQSVSKGDEVFWKVKVTASIPSQGGQYIKPGSKVVITDDNPSGLIFVGKNSYEYTVTSIESQKNSLETKNGIIWEDETIFRTKAPNVDGDFRNTATAKITSIFDEEISKRSNEAKGVVSTGNDSLSAPKGEWAYMYNLGPSNANGDMPVGMSSISQANPNPNVPNNQNTRLGFSMNYNPVPIISRDFFKSLSTGYQGSVSNNGREAFKFSIDIGWDQGTHPRRVRKIIIKDLSRRTQKTYEFDNSGNSTDGSGLRINYAASQHYGTATLNIPRDFFNRSIWNGTKTRHNTINISLINDDAVDFGFAHEGIGPDWNIGWTYNRGWGDYNPTKNDYHFVGMKREIDRNLKLDEIRVSIGTYFAFGRANYQVHGGKIANGTSLNYPSISVELNTTKGRKVVNINLEDHTINRGGPFYINGSNKAIYFPNISLKRSDLGLSEDEHVSSYNVIYGKRDRSEILNAGFAAHIEDFYKINPNLNNNSSVRVMNKNESFGELALVNLDGTGSKVQPFVRRPIGAVDDNGLINTSLGPRTAVIMPKQNTEAYAKVDVEFKERDGNVITTPDNNILHVEYSNVSTSSENLQSPLNAAVLLPEGVTVNRDNPNWRYSGSRGQVEQIIDNFNNSGRQLIVYRWLDGSGGGQLKPGAEKLVFEVNVKIQKNAKSNMFIDVYGSSNNTLKNVSGNDLLIDTADIDLDGNKTEKVVHNRVNYTYVSNDNVKLKKFVKGNLDDKYGTMGHVNLGGEIKYKLRIDNESGNDIHKMVIIDILPSVGDKTLLSNEIRNTKFTPTLSGPIRLPASLEGKVEVYYSKSKNPKRSDLINSAYYPNNSLVPSNPSEAEDPNWVLESSVENWEEIYSIKLVLKSGQVIPSGQEIDFSMKAPKEVFDSRIINPAKEQEIFNAAWNSFAATTNNLLPSEPLRVGVVLKLPNIDLRIKKINEDGSKTLAGARFELYKKNGASRELIATQETVDNGEENKGVTYFRNIEVPSAGGINTYIIKEIQSPSGYYSDIKEITVNVNDKGEFQLIDNNKLTSLSKYIVKNGEEKDKIYQELVIKNKDRVHFRIKKVNEDNSMQLSGAKFRFYEENSTSQEEKVTATDTNSDINGYIYINSSKLILPNRGNIKRYVIEEVTAPEGYQKYINKIFINLDSNGQITLDQNSDNNYLTLENITISDEISGVPIESRFGEDVTYNVGDKINQLVVKNSKTTNILINKIDGITSEKLSGVKFKLATSFENAQNNKFVRYKEHEGNKIVLYEGDEGYETSQDYEVTTQEDGTAQFNNLKTNKVYWIKEVKAKEGYMLLTKARKVTMGDNDLTTVDITNKKISELPHTAGPGIYLFLLSGGCIIVCSFVYRNRRINKNN